MSDWALRVIGTTALVLLALEVVALGSLLPLDDAAWRLVLLWRGCGSDDLFERVLDVTTWSTLVVLLGAVIGRARAEGIGAAWPPLAVSAVGLLANDALKEFFARERPSNLADVVLGHSFPSGHVMNGVLAAAAVYALSAGFRHPWRWRGAVSALVAVTTLCRVGLGAHWLLDVVGGALGALALFGLALPSFRRRPLAAPAAVALACAALLVLAPTLHATPLQLPSPLTRARPGASELDVGTPAAAPALRGGWEEMAADDTGGTLTWMRGAATLHPMLPGKGPGPGRLAFAGRPAVPRDRCLRLRVRVNDREIGAFVPFNGWREYRLPIPTGLLRAGVNAVELRITCADGMPWRFAVAYLRLSH